MAKKRSRTATNKGNNALISNADTKDRILDIVMELHEDDETTRGGHTSNNKAVSPEEDASANTDADTDGNGSLSVKDLLGSDDDDSNGAADDSADGSSTRSKGDGKSSTRSKCHSLNRVTSDHSDTRSGISSDSNSTFDGVVDDGSSSSIGRSTSTSSTAATIKTQTTSSTKETPSIPPKRSSSRARRSSALESNTNTDDGTSNKEKTEPATSSREHRRSTGRTTSRKAAPFTSSAPPVDGSMQEYAYNTKQQLNNSRKKQFAKQIDKWATDSTVGDEESHQTSASSRSIAFVPPPPRGTSRRHKVAPNKNNNSSKRRGIREDSSSTASSQTEEFREVWMGKPESSSSSTTPTISWVNIMRPIIKLFDGVNLKTLVLCFIGTQMILKLTKTSSPSGAIMPQPRDTAASASSPDKASFERQFKDASRLTRDLKETSTPGVRGAMNVIENNSNGNQNVHENRASVGSSIKSKEEEVQVDEKEDTVTAVMASSLADDTTSLQDLDFRKQQTLYLHQPPQDLAIPQPPHQTLGDSHQNPYLIQHPTTNLVVAQQQEAPTLQVQEPSQQLVPPLDLYQQQVQEQGQPLATQTQQSTALNQQQQVFNPSQQQQHQLVQPQQVVNQQTGFSTNVQGAVAEQHQYYDPQTQQHIIQPVSSLQQMQPQQQQVVPQQGYTQQPQSIHSVQDGGIHQ